MFKTKVILVFGIPGSGKTTLIQKAVNNLSNYMRVSGGSLISKEISDSERDCLRMLSSSEILYNQNLLVHNFQKLLTEKTNTNLIFDGHCLIKDGNKSIEVPVDIIKGLSPNKIIYLDESPETIVKRRAADSNRPNREVESAYELAIQRSKQLEICRTYSKKLSVTLEVLNAPTVQEFINVLNN